MTYTTKQAMLENEYSDQLHFDWTLFQREYSFRSQKLSMRLFFNHVGLIMEISYNFFYMEIPLYHDPRYAALYNAGEDKSKEGTILVDDLAENLSEISSWLKDNPGKPFSDFIILKKLRATSSN